MKKVNWGTIVIITGIIGWILTALYGAAKRLDCKYWKEKWEKEMENGISWAILAKDFKFNWDYFKKGDDNEFYKRQLDNNSETCERYKERDRY